MGLAISAGVRWMAGERTGAELALSGRTYF
jgi:hypothetical protein